MSERTEVMRYLDEEGNLVVGLTYEEEGTKMAEITCIEYSGESDGMVILDTVEIAEELLLRMVEAIRVTGAAESPVEEKNKGIPLSELEVGDKVTLISPSGMKTFSTITEVLRHAVRDDMTGETEQCDIDRGWRFVKGWDA